MAFIKYANSQVYFHTTWYKIYLVYIGIQYINCKKNRAWRVGPYKFNKCLGIVPHNLAYAERNKWFILTHLCESGYCLQINPDYQVILTQLLKIFRSMTQICEISRDENHNLTLSLHATQFTVLYHWEVLVRISTLTLRFHGNLSYFLFIWHC